MPVVITYRFGPFRLLPDQRRLERDGSAVPMTPKRQAGTVSVTAPTRLVRG